ncbi:disease resistance-like protein DSC2 [Carya illinoinensis]|uniref:disease resistance-like protein DSC2 n=1 Tax=Carya illinoinensis TaxID=32201 RepID=UPI001C725975|nr:disease resistance-like protein DSC2 [Carya illinoinensis]
MVNQTPLSVVKYPIGIESRIRHIYQRLSIGKNDIILIVGIFGTGGIGKITISKDIYDQISSQFKGSCFLEEVRETSKQTGENLVGDRASFGSGSRIIIITRDQQLLKSFEVDSKYEVEILDDNEALWLFSLHAFKKDEPLDGYVELSKQVIKYAQGLPLALTVLGSDVKGQSIYQWKSALDKYKNIPNGKIQKVLLVSYEGLDDIEREIFLDIAFFFKGESLPDVMKIFDYCGFFSRPWNQEA